MEGKIEKPANYPIHQQFLTDFNSFSRAKQLFQYKVARPLTCRANWSSTSVPRPLGEWAHLWTPRSTSDDHTPRPPATSTQPRRSAPGPNVQQTARSIAGPGDSKFDQVKRRVPAGTHPHDIVSALQSTDETVQEASKPVLRACEKRISRPKHSEGSRVLSSIGESKFHQVKKRVLAEIHPHEIISALQSTGGSVQVATEIVLRACEERISRPKNSESNRVLSSTPGNAPPKKRPPPPMDDDRT